ncbi:MAG: hypothetical protein WC460_00410 [Patescibacteria group bacterium]
MRIHEQILEPYGCCEECGEIPLSVCEEWPDLESESPRMQMYHNHAIPWGMVTLSNLCIVRPIEGERETTLTWDIEEVNSEEKTLATLFKMLVAGVMQSDASDIHVEAEDKSLSEYRIIHNCDVKNLRVETFYITVKKVNNDIIFVSGTYECEDADDEEEEFIELRSDPGPLPLHPQESEKIITKILGFIQKYRNS